MATVNAYLVFNGTCETAFNFYKYVFGKEFSSFSRFSDIPPSEDMPIPIPEECKNLVLHVSLPLRKETILMGSDANPNMGVVTVGQNISLSIGTDSKEEADKIFNRLAEGGNITMPMANTFWGAYFGMISDQFGNSWMVNCDIK
ncbi:MAG: VOC family protein [Ginsengibacter sp.]